MARNAALVPVQTAAPSRVDALEGTRVERPEPKPGEYWRLVKADGKDSDAFGEGDVLLVEDVAHVEGILHQVHVGGHPRAPHGGTWRMLTAEFLDRFEPAPGWEAVRSGEISATIAELDDLRRKLEIGDGIERDRALLGAPQPSLPAPMGQVLVAGDQEPDAMRKRMAQAEGRARREVARIEGVVASMGETSKRLARYMEEKSVAAQASVSKVLALADWYRSGAATVGLFAGQGVTQTRLCDGPAAPAGRLHVMQRLLFMDEEYLVNLASGGAEWSDLEDFGKALGADPSFLQRIFPFERCVVAMRYRRHDKDYMSEAVKALGGMRDVLRAANELLAAAKAADEKNRWNRETFLLVRNGRRVTQIHADLSTDRIERLYPTRADLDAHFKRRSYAGNGEYEYEPITLESLGITEALEELECQKVQYRRLVVTMWGVHERDGDVFGRFYDPARHPTWLSVDFQKECLVLVRDDEGTLDSGRPRFAQFQDQCNERVRGGSRVLCRWSQMLTQTAAPGAWTNPIHAEPRRIFDPDEKFSIARVRVDKGRLLVDCPASAEGSWHRAPRAAKRRANIAIDFMRVGEGWLVLDDIEAADLVWYLHNRADRAHYLDYFLTFEAARKTLRTEEAAFAPLVASLAAELGATGRWPEADLPAAVSRAIRRWRAANRWQMPDDVPQTRAALREIVWHELEAAAPAAIEAGRKACEAAGRSFLRMAAFGRRRVVYAGPTDAERLETAFMHPFDGWVARFGTDAAGSLAGEPKWLAMGEASPAEIVLGESAGAKAAGELAVPPLGRAACLAHRQQSTAWREALASWLAPMTLADVRRQIARYWEWRKGNLVEWPYIFAGLGTRIRPAGRHHTAAVGGIGMAAWLPAHVLLRLPPSDREAGLDLMSNIYQRKTSLRERLAEDRRPVYWCETFAARAADGPADLWVREIDVKSAHIGMYDAKAGDEARSIAIVEPEALEWARRGRFLKERNAGIAKADAAAAAFALREIRPDLASALRRRNSE